MNRAVTVRFKKFFLALAEQNLDVLVFWFEIVLNILHYRHRVANFGVFQTDCSTHQILCLEVSCFFKTCKNEMCQLHFDFQQVRT